MRLLFLSEPVIFRIIEPVLRKVQPQHFVPGIASEVVGVVHAGEVGIRVGLRQGLAPWIVNGMGDDLAALIHREQCAAKMACPIPHLADIVGSEVTLQVLAAFAPVQPEPWQQAQPFCHSQ